MAEDIRIFGEILLWLKVKVKVSPLLRQALLDIRQN